MIIGLTGSLAAGKGIVSDFLKEKDFIYYSLANEVRLAAEERRIEITRKNLQDLGNQLRKERGSGVLAKLIYNKIHLYPKEERKVIVDGIRNPAEVDKLKQFKDFYLVSVDAPADERFKRMCERKRESDPKTWEEFLAIDKRDKGIGEKEFGQAVGKCMQMADYTLINDCLIEDTREKFERIYEDIISKGNGKKSR